MNWKFTPIAVACWLGLAGPALAQSCDATPERHAVRILGTNVDGNLSPHVAPYVAGNRHFFQELDNGWTFALVPNEHGWSIRLYAYGETAPSTDLTSLTPPHSGAPNPRDIYGWHFRNAANTAPNTGDVNAPQEMRAFVISPALEGTGGYRPATDPGADRLMEPGPDDGIGWLKLLDYGLAGLAPGERARMNYMEFEACLTWPRSAENAAMMADLASLDYTDTDHETFGSCGLDLQAHTLSAAYLPRILGGDIDGDDAIDEIAQIERTSDGKLGLALCRAGTWLEPLGLDGPVGDIRAGYFDQAETWHWLTPGGNVPIQFTGMEMPASDGDVLIVERVEKEAAVMYWRDGRLHGEMLYSSVEP